MDIEYLLWLQGIREAAPDFVNSFFLVISEVAGTGAPLLVTAVLLWSVNKRLGYLVGFNFAACYFVNQVLKIIGCVYRPWVRDARIVPEEHALGSATGYSFPSGHVSVATSFYGTLAIHLRRNVPAFVALIVLLVLTSFSRNWLGCHTPQDVLLSFVFSVIVMAIVYAVTRQLEKHPSWDVLITVLICALSIASLIFCLLKQYPIDYDTAGSVLVDPYAMQTDCFKGAGSFMGLAIAWLIERRFVHYAVEGSLAQRVGIAIVGLAVLGLLYGALLPEALSLFLDDHWSHFFKYFLTMLLAVAGYPACIMAWRSHRPVK